MPRSGSTWLGCIFDSSPNVAYRLQPLFSYTHKGKLNEVASLSEINTFFKEIYLTKDPYVLQFQAKEKNLVPKFKKEKVTHIVYKEVRYHHIIENLLKEDEDIIVVGIIRSPFSVINSWLKAPKEFKKELGWKVDEEWRYAPQKNGNRPEEFNGYEKWKEVAHLFLRIKNNYPNRFYLLEYEDLLKNNLQTVSSLFKFCNLEVTKQTLDFLLESTNIQEQDAYSVFKKKENDMAWKKELPQFIIDEIRNDDDFKKLNEIFQWI